MKVFFNTKTVEVVGCVTASSKTLDELQLEYDAKILVLDAEDAYSRQERKYITEAVEITEEEFWYFLEVLPPLRWERRKDSESFALSERIYGSITTNCVRKGERYFKFADYDNLTHDERLEKVNFFLRKRV